MEILTIVKLVSLFIAIWLDYVVFVATIRNQSISAFNLALAALSTTVFISIQLKLF